MEPVDLVTYGDLLSTRLTVYVHGFGVNYESRGLFTNLAQKLAAEDQRSVLFDLSDYDDDGNRRLLPLDQQVDRLARVVQQVGGPGPELSLTGHSLGCLVIASYLVDRRPEAGRIVFLAPVTHDRVGESMETGYRRWPTTRAMGDGIEIVGRSGRRTQFSRDYLDQLNLDTGDLYRRLAAGYGRQSLVVWAGDDRRSGPGRGDFQGVATATIDGADHNFSQHQNELVRAILAQPG